jgi:hypothetical protein
LILIGALLALVNGCAVVSTVSVQQKPQAADSDKAELVGWKKQRALAGIWRVDAIDVNLFDPRDPEKPSWWPAKAVCEHPFPVKGKVRAIALESAVSACQYQFDQSGRLESVVEPSGKIGLSYSNASTKIPESVSLGDQSYRLKFDQHGNLLEELGDNGDVRNEFGRITWPDRIVVTQLAGDGESTTVLSQKFYDLTGQLIGEISDEGAVDLRVTEAQGKGYSLKVSTAPKEAPEKSMPAWRMNWKDGLLVGLQSLPGGKETPISYEFDKTGNWIERDGQGAKAMRRIEYF